MFIAGLSIVLNGVERSGEIPITEVGDGDDAALLCVTDLDPCCSIQTDWFFPNGNRVESEFLAGNTFGRDRGPSVVRLHRPAGVMQPTGMFCCEAPTVASPDSTERLCITLSTYVYIIHSSAKPKHSAQRKW